MKRLTGLTVTVVFICVSVYVQPQTLQQSLSNKGMAAFNAKRESLYKWDPLEPLVGTWKGDAKGTAGQGIGEVTIKRDLDGKVITITNSQNFGETKDRPTRTFRSLMVVYLEGLTPRANFYDNEGHYLSYDVVFSKDVPKITFISDVVQNAPRFRFSYETTKQGQLKGVFEVAPPGSRQYTQHVEGSAQRAQ